ncbi:hypothetical protein BT96DRAFT_803550, partial [Gymnopus androsaceus JB14]
IKLAKFKAVDLEDFCGDDKVMDFDVPDEVTDEGIKIIDEFLRSWATTAPTDGEDIVMSLEEE